jgi:protein-L-isoaspartate(D-aspartate) O-methyltransferase
MTDYARARANMVESQLRPNRVSDPAVLDAFRAVAREEFLPDWLKAKAYADEDIKVPGGTLIQPMVLGRLINEASIAPTDHVLVVGCPRGYAAAVISLLSPNVATLHGTGMGSATLPPGPFDVILLAGAVPQIPDHLFGRLADGGRLVGVIRAAGSRIGEAVIIERIGDAQSRRVLFDAASPYLPGFDPAFTFAF